MSPIREWGEICCPRQNASIRHEVELARPKGGRVVSLTSLHDPTQAECNAGISSGPIIMFRPPTRGLVIESWVAELEAKPVRLQQFP